MSSNDLTRNSRLAILIGSALVAGVCLVGCARTPPQKVVYIQWRALLIYHPLWESQQIGRNSQPPRAATDQRFPAHFSLPQTTLQPLQTPESERRRQRIAQASAQQQQALDARLRQMEARLLQEELAQLEAEQKTEVELARQQLLQQAEQQIADALRQHHLPQADAEIRRLVLQRLVRIRPDQRDALNSRLQEVEAEQLRLSESLQQRLAAIAEETARRIREREEAIEQEYQRKREELRQRSAARLQAEQLRASIQIRAFADTAKPVVFPRTTLKTPIGESRAMPPPSAPVFTREDVRLLIEQDVKQRVEAICRRHRWKPVWQARAGIPDVTAQIALEMSP